MPYAAEISRRNPTCFIFLIDRSGSMAEPLAGAPGKTKAQGVAETINSLLYNFVIKTTTGTGLFNRYFIGVIGYGAVTWVAVSDDSRRAASTGLDKMVRVWDLDRKTETAVLQSHTDATRVVAFFPGGQDGHVRH
ncbi:MAG: hypothetical protein JWO38_1617 [Gemmataceae bacterium]|nr:hypothetical protein [Gemmataceae bacterium]